MWATNQSPRERELRGHGNERLELPMHDDSSDGPNPSGLCMCGCGETTTVAYQNDPKARILKGQHRRFRLGHACRGVKRSPETLERMSAAQKGRVLGPKSPRWNGGTLTRYGRVYRFVGKGHPMADVNGYAGEHRLSLAGVLGRPLTSAECVHHIDLDKTNNAPGNLVALTRSQHQTVHSLIARRGMDPRAALETVLARGAK